MATPPRIAVVQDGARLHYAVPVALHRRNILERVFCDWYSRPGSPSRAAARIMRLAKPDLGQRMLDRYAAELGGAAIISNPFLTWRTMRAKPRFKSERDFYHWESSRKGDWIRQKGLGAANTLFGFVRNIDPELCAWARSKGIYVIGDQIIAPYAVERAEELRQEAAFPEFISAPTPPEDEEWNNYEHRTWKTLDLITCASEYVRDGLVAQGIDRGRIKVNPYPVNTTDFSFVDRSGRKGPLTVGFIGAVNLRKGAPYFFKAARMIDPALARFVMVGPIGIHPEAAKSLGKDVELAGPVPRSQVRNWLARFDVFFFPSTCEGSAGSVMEAMATGLPIVTSPNSGSIVRAGHSGFIYRYDAVDEFASAITQLARDANLRLEMGRNAREDAESAGIETFGEHLATFASMGLVTP